MKKWIIIFFSVLLIFIVGCTLKLFIIGEPIDDDTLDIRVEEGDRQIAIYIQVTDSASAISNLQYRYNGTVMYLTPWKVLSSPFHNDGEMCLYYEIVDETEIWLGDQLIWSAQ